MLKKITLILILLGFLGFSVLAFLETPPKKVEALITSYFAHRWSDHGAYKQVSVKGKRMGNFVALNFLPSGSIIEIPELLKTTKLEVADTLGGRGVGYYKGKKYWRVDILRNKHEWMDDFDHPLEIRIVKINHKGRFRDKIVKANYQQFLKKGTPD